MSQDDTPITMSTHGSLEACEAEQARRAASASQSSTPVPRVGGPDEAKSADQFGIALNVQHPECHKAADAFWAYWKANGETHKKGYYESTWGAINQALKLVGVAPWSYGGSVQASDLAHVARQESAADTGAALVQAQRDAFATYMACPTPRNFDALLESVSAVCDGLAAVPPAKAEGLTERWTYVRDNYFKGTMSDDCYSSTTAEMFEAAVDKALAQIAKGATK